MSKVQRWTGSVSAFECGGFVCYGDYLELEAERDALIAYNARLQEALKEVLDGETANDEDVLAIIYFARETLSSTPEQSLAKLRNQIRKEIEAEHDDGTIDWRGENEV